MNLITCKFLRDLLPKKQVHSVYDIWQIAKNMITNDKEYLIRFDLNSTNHIVNKEVISIGTLTGLMIHPRELFKSAIINSACSIVIAHNHPSEDCTPSEGDIERNEAIVEAGKLLEIEVKDHIIFCDKEFYSMKEGGYFNDGDKEEPAGSEDESSGDSDG